MMYVREVTVSLPDKVGESAQVGDYVLTLTGSERYADGQDGEAMRVELDVTRAGEDGVLGRVSPSMKVAAATSQTTLDAAVMTFPSEDLFVAFQGMNADGTLSINVKVNPPSMKVAAATSQTTLDAAVMTFPSEDLFVAFQGMNADGTLSINVKVNPLILFTWAGGAISTLGIVLAFAPRRATPLLNADDRDRVRVKAEA